MLGSRRRRLQWLLPMVVTMVLCGAKADAACEALFSQTQGKPYTSVCAGVLDYDPFVGTCQAAQEYESSGVNYLGLAKWNRVASIVSSACAVNLMRYYCAFAYRPCDPDTGTEHNEDPPSELVDNFLNDTICTDDDRARIGASVAVLTGNLASWNPAALPNSAAAHVVLKEQPVLQLGTCGAYTGTICEGVVDYDVYIPGGLTIAAIEAVKGPTLQVLLRASNRKECLPHYAKLICGSVFPRCVHPFTQVSAMVTIPFPQLPSRSVCESVHDNCRSELLQGQFGNCSGTFTTARTCSGDDVVSSHEADYYGEEVTDYGGGLEIPTTNMSTVTVEIAKMDIGECESPLVRPHDPTYCDSDTDCASCALPCPSLLYSDDSYEKSDKLMVALSFISLVASSFMLLTWIIFKAARKTLYPIFFVVQVWAISLVLFFSVAVKQQDGKPAYDGVYARVQCKDNSKISQSGYCAFTAVVFIYCGLCACCWWCVQAVELYLQIRFNVKSWPRNHVFAKNAAYYAWAWGYPLVAVIVVAATDNIGNANIGIPWCFIIDADLAWGIFYSPIALQCVVGCTAMGAIIYAIYASSRAVGSDVRKGSWVLYARPLLFIFAYLVVWTLIFAYRFSEYFNEDKYRHQAEKQVRCLMGGKTRHECAELGFSGPKSNIGLWYMIQIDIGLVGVIGFLLYFTGDNAQLWVDFVRGGCRTRNVQASRQGKELSFKKSGSSKKLSAMRMETSTSSLPQNSERSGRQLVYNSLGSVGSTTSAQEEHSLHSVGDGNQRI